MKQLIFSVWVFSNASWPSTFQALFPKFYLDIKENRSENLFLGLNWQMSRVQHPSGQEDFNSHLNEESLQMLLSSEMTKVNSSENLPKRSLNHSEMMRPRPSLDLRSLSNYIKRNDSSSMKVKRTNLIAIVTEYKRSGSLRSLRRQGISPLPVIYKLEV